MSGSIACRRREPSAAAGDWSPSAPEFNDAWSDAMEAVHLNIEGMTCEHCVRAVDGRLRRTPGVQVEKVVVGAADLRYDPSRVSLDEISEAISDEGYTVE
jgi:copper chaperone